MKALRKYVRKKLKDTFQEETSSSQKKDDVKTDGSLWDAAFNDKDKKDPAKSDKTMWDLKFGAGSQEPKQESK